MARIRWALPAFRQKYTPVPGDEAYDAHAGAVAEAYSEKPADAPTWATRRPRWLIVAAFLSTILFLSLFVTSNKTFHDWVPSPFRPSYLFFLVPAQTASAGLCKTLTSSAVLGFPPPNLIGWGKKYENVRGGEGVGKLTNTLSFLEKLDSTQDEALVLVVDGGSSWFQLRPDVLISRYLDINHAGNKRIHSQIGRAMIKEGIQQRIVFAAREDCSDHDVFNPRCFAVPNSPLPPASLPPSTDSNPRFMAGHSFIGPVRDLRILLRRAKQKSVRAKDGSTVPLEAIFAEIFAEQEIQRERSRSVHRSWIVRTTDNWQHRTSFLDTNHDLPSADAAEGRNYEFGIGLDYSGLIFAATPPTSGHTHSTAFLTHSRPESLDAGANGQQLRLTVPAQTLSAVSDAALMGSKLPFWTPAHARHPDLPPQNTSWAEVPLYTDLDTGVAPVTVPSFNAHTGDNVDDADGWFKSWLANSMRLRHLLYARGVSPIGRMANVKLPSNAQPFDPLMLASTSTKNAAGIGPSHSQRPLSAYEDTSLYYDSATRRPRPLHEQLTAYAATLPQTIVNGVRGYAEHRHEWFPAGIQREGAHVWGGPDVQWDVICGDDRRVWGDLLGRWRQTQWWPEA